VEPVGGGVGVVGFAPNPMVERGAISFVLRSGGEVSFRVFDVRGRLVWGGEPALFESGLHSLEWDGRGFTGDFVPNGIYFVRLFVDGRGSAVAKFVVAR
jgi:hypothetical protein